MRLLLIAYEFPPSPSPQSLRWTYLARELARLGHELHVLAPDLGGETPGLPELPDAVTVHRCFPGPFRGLMAMRRKQRHRRILQSGSMRQDTPSDSGAPAALRPPRNWKQRISELVQKTLEFMLFPDLRGEWHPWAARALPPLLARIQPDAVISSHEPATTLELGLLAQAHGVHWIADLGDPVLAGYTPRRWRRQAQRVESAVCRQADLITVTNEATTALLERRHGRKHGVMVLTQGFDASNAPENDSPTPFDPNRLELFYSGSLYRFRRIDALLYALKDNPNSRLNIAAITVPEHILEFARTSPEQVRLLGFLPHAGILSLQRQAHVLVNIANDDITQIPGKFYEYLGAGRPILHLGHDSDPIGAQLLGLRRGWTCENDAAALSERIRKLAQAHFTGSLESALDLTPEPVAAWSWQSIAMQLEKGLHMQLADSVQRQR